MLTNKDTSRVVQFLDALTPYELREAYNYLQSAPAKAKLKVFNLPKPIVVNKKYIVENRAMVRDAVEKKILQMFLDFGGNQIYLSLRDIQNECFDGNVQRDLPSVLAEDIKANGSERSKVRRYSYMRWSAKHNYELKETVYNCGRAYLFNRSDFVTN